MLNKTAKKANNLYKLYNFIIDTIIICIGLFISSFGTALFYQSGMGSGGMATFCDGLHLLFNVSYGTMYIVVNVIFLILLIIFDKTMINVGTLMCAFIIGIFVDLGNSILSRFHIGESGYLIRFVCMLAGCALMGIGLALYVAVDRGYGVLEGMVKYICSKTKISFDKIKIAQDFILLSLGILLKANWGIGTVISAITIGPIMNFFIEKFEKLLKSTRIKYLTHKG